MKKWMIYSCYNLLCLLLVSKLHGQCIKINIPPQLQLCSNDQGFLPATVNGTIITAAWAPAQGLDNPLLLNPTIQTPFDTTYTLYIKGFQDSLNLLTNSDFSQGNVGFTSDYTPNSPQSGGYIIGVLGTDLYQAANACSDHTTSDVGGNMLLANINATNKAAIYCQEVTVQPNQSYHFRGYALGLDDNAPPIIALSINETVIKRDTLGFSSCIWGQIEGEWQANQATTAKICIMAETNNTSGQAGFALDDVGFYATCEVAASVEVQAIDLEVQTPADPILLDCGDSLRLPVSVIPNDVSFETEWSTTDGHIIAGRNSLEPLINEPGWYEVEVATTLNNRICRDKDRIQVISTSKDTISITVSGNLACGEEKVSLSVNDVSDTATTFLYEWNTLDGNIISPTNQQSIEINQPGLYEVSRLDASGSCERTAQIQMEANRLEDFTFELIPPNCEIATGTILFQNIIGGTLPFRYSIDGGQTFQTTTQFAGLNEGTYSLVIIDGNGCQLEKIIDLPAFSRIQLTIPTTLSFNKTDTTKQVLPLTANLPISEIANIQWTPSTGLSCADCLQPILNFPSSSTYQVAVTDKNGCTAQASINIQFVESSDVYIPTVFSPNNDGVNDFFMIYTNDEVVEKVERLAIFDRYGNLLFDRQHLKNNAINQGWDGQLNGETLGTGVYVYSATVLLKNGKTRIYKGTISLVR